MLDPKRAANGVYYLRGSYLGVAVRQSLRTRDKATADALTARIVEDIRQRVAYGRKRQWTFAEAALSYMEGGGETRFMKPILEHFGPSTTCDEIDFERFELARRALYPDAAPATVRRQLRVPIVAVLNMAHRERRADPPLLAHRWRKARGRDAAEGRRVRWLEIDELERLIAAARARIAAAETARETALERAANAPNGSARARANYARARATQHERGARTLAALVGLLAGSGCRSSEALGLDVTLIYPTTRQAFIAASKSGAQRMIEWPAMADELLRLSPSPESGRRFLTGAGKPYVLRKNSAGQFAHAFRAICDAAGLGPDVTPHVLRHTWATYFYAQTLDFIRLMDLGGWATESEARRYTKIAPKDLGTRLYSAGWRFIDEDPSTRLRRVR